MSMNVGEIKKKVNLVSDELLKEKGFIAPVDVLIKMDVISKKTYEDWRFGRIPYLEKVCNCGLGKLSTVMKELRIIRKNRKLKESWTSYKKWGKGKAVDLRFSKSNSPSIEKAYGTHLLGMDYKKPVEKNQEQENDGMINNVSDLI